VDTSPASVAQASSRLMPAMAELSGAVKPFNGFREPTSVQVRQCCTG
jgi:hypothetical protein